MCTCHHLQPRVRRARGLKHRNQPSSRLLATEIFLSGRHLKPSQLSTCTLRRQPCPLRSTVPARNVSVSSTRPNQGLVKGSSNEHDGKPHRFMEHAHYKGRIGTGPSVFSLSIITKRRGPPDQSVCPTMTGRHLE